MAALKGGLTCLQAGLIYKHQCHAMLSCYFQLALTVVQRQNKDHTRGGFICRNIFPFRRLASLIDIKYPECGFVMYEVARGL